MKLIFLLMSAALFLSGCAKNYTDFSCINNKIAKIKAQKKWNPPAQVDEYLYQGKKVFLFSSDCCDQYHYLYDENCNVICAPSGGFTGHGDGKCANFFNEAQHIRLVWKDDR
ncbi:MAG: hypothetical protein V9F02_07665 [Chitinophagaceae bacterium]